ncbi:hypothetical protein [Pyxidicoccus sp. MSG2]|uniref:hypothetical protein n=1 Tax=Pyxidicoccus sp. MSG2 TaxID=2996790 RepID=UPI00226D6762|nr:hypothetical protein [Pyxidicoccus sp. MSG2]MCY1018992.1 hypothetical protein [Pyxidicoccus sp. MSG2]
MAGELDALKGARDAVFAQPPGEAAWKELVAVVEQAWALAPGDVAAEWVPALTSRFASWPPGLRDAPASWVQGVEEGRAPLLVLADTFEAAKKLKPAERRKFIDRLAKLAPSAASNALAYFVRVEDRTMMKQLADFGALAAPGVIAALREPDATEKRYETVADLAKQLGSGARDAADAMADLVVTLRARRPSQKTTPILLRLTEALLGCGAPRETLRRSLTPLLDSSDASLRSLARRELESRGLPAPHSPWESSAVGWPVIAELQRLGCSFHPHTPKLTRMKTPAGEVEVPQPFRDLFTVKWAARSFRGSTWMFGGDAHGEVSVSFRTPHFLDYEAYAKRPYVQMATDGCGGYYYHLCLEDVPATQDDTALANIPVYRLERGGEWYHPYGKSFTTLQTFLSNLHPF